jgi:hypothetical protein
MTQARGIAAHPAAVTPGPQISQIAQAIIAELSRVGGNEGDTETRHRR